jgi:hypothetical protein
MVFFLSFFPHSIKESCITHGVGRISPEKKKRREKKIYKTSKLNNKKGGGDLEMGRPTGSERQS